MEHLPCTQKEEIAHINKKLSTQKQLGEETFAKVEAVEKSLDEHRTAQQLHEQELSKAMKEINKTIKIVNDQLIPVYKKEQRNSIADEVIMERAGTWKFWAKFVSTIAAAMVVFGWILKQAMK